MNKDLKIGFTTGSCAAAASKAAVYMLLTGLTKNEISIETPAGIMFDAEILDISRTADSVSCAVRKDGGSDPDITSGALIYSKVTAISEYGSEINVKSDSGCKYEIRIDGGEGVGRVTKPGLDRPVGDAAINSVPRSMIAKEVSEVLELLDYEGTIDILISVPGGELIAEQTFNPRLGIVGGISILGTSGIVEPMSTGALLDTIKVELNQKKALNMNIIPMSPGNYGLEFMKKAYDFDLDVSVKCSNFIGDSIDMAAELGIKNILLTGHIGKLIKVSGGIMNTHSKEGDCRMELICAAALKNGAGVEILSSVMDCVSTEAALAVLATDKELFDNSMQYICDRVMYFLNKRANNRLHIECMIYSNDFGLLCKSSRAEEFIEIIKKDL